MGKELSRRVKTRKALSEIIGHLGNGLPPKSVHFSEEDQATCRNLPVLLCVLALRLLETSTGASLMKPITSPMRLS